MVIILETSLKSQRILSNLRREGIAGLETVECLWRAPKNDYRSRALHGQCGTMAVFNFRW